MKDLRMHICPLRSFIPIRSPIEECGGNQRLTLTHPLHRLPQSEGWVAGSLAGCSRRRWRACFPFTSSLDNRPGVEPGGILTRGSRSLLVAHDIPEVQQLGSRLPVHGPGGWRLRDWLWSCWLGSRRGGRSCGLWLYWGWQGLDFHFDPGLYDSRSLVLAPSRSSSPLLSWRLWLCWGLHDWLRSLRGLLGDWLSDFWLGHFIIIVLLLCQQY